MTAVPSLSAEAVRDALLLGREIAIVDLRPEAQFATGHPLFAAQLPPDRVAVEAQARFPRKGATIVVYGEGDDQAEAGAAAFYALGYTDVRRLEGGLKSWRAAGLELFQDVNSYSKAFGELVEHRRGTPSLPAPEVKALIEAEADIAILDARRFDEYATMSLPGAISVPGAELALRAPVAAPDAETTIIVNCAGRTRSIIGAQSLINAGLPNRVVALRNGTIGWTLAGLRLDQGAQHHAPEADENAAAIAQRRAASVAYRAGVRRIGALTLAELLADQTRTTYRFDPRTPEEYRRGHPEGFRSAPGGQLVQETDHFAPVRGARVVLVDDGAGRALMTASWLAQMGWETFVVSLDPAHPVETGDPHALPPRGPAGRYRRPYEGTDNPAAAMQAYLEWEYGLVAQLERDGTHGFFVI
jgi:rhodanese-related sulfurtransferase